MGQKANPISLRLKTTNNNFDSCWYSDLHYSTLLSLEVKARSYIEKVFEQIRYPRPLISVSLIPKRGKVLMCYLNPEKLRGQRNERFQLKSFIPPHNVESHIHLFSTRTREALHMLGLDGDVGTTKFFVGNGSLLYGEPRSSNWKSKITQMQTNRTRESGLGSLGWGMNTTTPSLAGGSLVVPGQRERRGPISASYKQEGWMPNWERRVFIYSTLLSITKRRSNTARLLFDKNFALFSKIKGLDWFQGRGESWLSSTNLCLPVNNRQAGERLTKTNKSKGKRIFLPRSQASLGWGSWATHAKQGHPERRGIMNESHITAETSVKKPVFVPETSVKSNKLDSYFWINPSIREIRRKDAHSSIDFMEVTLGRGLGISTTIYPYKSIEEEQTAQFLSEEIAYYLERRIPFRRIKQALMREVQKNYIQGIKVSCSGRVGGRSKKAQRSREESFQLGQTSSHVFSSKLSFASRGALTPFGKVGIKVWICYK